MGAKVLVIDDDERIARMLGRVVRLDDLRVHISPDGRHSVELARQLRPDLIILDIVLPGPDGFTVCRHLRRMGGAG